LELGLQVRVLCDAESTGPRSSMDLYLDSSANDVRLASQPKTQLVITLKQWGVCELSQFKYLICWPGFKYIHSKSKVTVIRPGHFHVQEGKVRAFDNFRFWVAHLIILLFSPDASKEPIQLYSLKYLISITSDFLIFSHFYLIISHVVLIFSLSAIIFNRLL
jgi:hypothetical protein